MTCLFIIFIGHGSKLCRDLIDAVLMYVMVVTPRLHLNFPNPCPCSCIILTAHLQTYHEHTSPTKMEKVWQGGKSVKLSNFLLGFNLFWCRIRKIIVILWVVIQKSCKMNVSSDITQKLCLVLFYSVCGGNWLKHVKFWRIRKKERLVWSLSERTLGSRFWVYSKSSSLLGVPRVSDRVCVLG